ncbi:hypothetical protein K7X08_034395 [Anisodus acutangulus]|uniref:Exoribonuclease phosphorolytic domain-containing protein n=1 Tax=Anisodus acutangulus TaxID=402998 RepID=A0A9Q1R0W5_9SOLA|nr:hypothetical protein K7X08_034395 [Anisodus acutangulus]
MGRGAFPTEDELSLQRLGLTVLKLERFIYSLGLQAYSKSNIHSEIAFANINRKGGNGGHFKSTFHEPESYLITWGITASSAYGTLRICKLIYESMRNKFEIEHQSFFQHEPKDTRDHVLLSSMFAVGIATAWSLDSNVISRVQVGLIGDKFIMKPILQEMENSQLDLLLTGTKSGISLIERYCDFLPEDRLLEIVEAGQNVVRRYISRSGVFESNKMMSELLEKDIGIKKGARFIWKMLVYCRPD